jgi:HD-like signal output (HDOD) protein
MKQPRNGRGSSVPGGDAALSPEAGDLATRLRAAVEDGSLALAPMPDIAHQVLSLLQDEETDTRGLLDMVHKDPAMVTAILRMSNSARFAGLRPANDLDQAVARLGLRQVGYIVTALIHRGHFTSRSPARQDLIYALWDHSVATAMACRHIAQARRGDAGQAFLAGLLHDTGKLLVLRGIEQADQASGARATPLAVALEVMDVLHPEMGYHALKTWRIPETLCVVARDHRRADLAPDDALIAEVQVASAVARKIGSHPEPDPELQLMELPSVCLLGLSEDDLATVIVALEDEICEFRQMV